jgi:(2Fe-2S) ferredoxin
MKTLKLKTQSEIFICNYKRDDGENCFDKGSRELTDQIKKWAKDNHKDDIKVFRSGCLGKCSEGIAALCYPEKIFLLDIKSDDVEEIKKGLRRDP